MSSAVMMPQLAVRQHLLLGRRTAPAWTSAPGERERMTSDDELLVRRDHPRRSSAARNADARTPGGVGGLVQTNAEPRGIPAHAPADGRRVLPDSGGEDESVETAERGGAGAEPTADTSGRRHQGATPPPGP